MEELENVYDVAIIGGGPAGSACALYTSRAKLKTVVLDKSHGAGALALTSKIANYPGVRGEIEGVELLEIMREQAKDFGAEYVQAAVQAVDLQSEQKQLYTTAGVYQAKTVVVATGSMGRKQRVPGEDALIGRGVSYCVICDAPFFTGREAAVIGDTDQALEEALYLARFASKVYLIAPRTEYRADPEFVQSVSHNPKIEQMMGWRLLSIKGDMAVRGIDIQSFMGEKKELAVGGVFILLTGMQPITDFLGEILPSTENGCIAIDDERQTALPGVYAVGDVTCDHVKQAIVAASEGVIAALAIDKYLNKREKVRLDYQ